MKDAIPADSTVLQRFLMQARLEALNRLTRTTAQAMTVDDIYEAALDAVTQALDVRRAAILLFDPDGMLRFKAWRGLSDQYRRATEGHSPWSADATDAEPVLVNSVEAAESLAALRPVILAEGIRALAFIPLIQPGRLLGKFMAYADVPRDFTPVEVMLAQVIAGHVAFAVERTQTDIAQQRLAAIVDSSDDAIISKSLQGIIQTWNRGAEQLFGYTAAEAIGHPITMLIPPEHVEEEADILARIRRGERIDHYETVRIRKDGRRIDVSLTVSPVRDRQGRIIGASKIARDVTVWKQTVKEREALLTREQVARADAEAANRAKDDFLMMLSHELRTPLNSILGWTKILSSAPHDLETVTRALDTITRNAKQQAQLIEDLLDVSSILGGRMRLTARPVDLVDVLATALETIRPAAAAKDLALETRFDPSASAVTGDPDRLQQVFWNLLSNAVKFTPRKGRIAVRLARARSRAVITVADTGIGIRPDLIPMVFDRYRQADTSIAREHGGLGLGLAIVRQLVEMHGGTVEATSSGQDQGATFTVYLPIAPLRPLPPAAPPLAVGDLTRCDGIRALIVDDEADGRELLKRFLEQCGAVVTVVDSAAEALTAIEQGPVDVVISDLAMPGVSGYEFIRRLRASPDGAMMPAIALTAHATGDARAKAFRAGFDTYLTKPVDPAELAAAVSRLARRSGPR